MNGNCSSGVESFAFLSSLAHEPVGVGGGGGGGLEVIYSNPESRLRLVMYLVWSLE